MHNLGKLFNNKLKFGTVLFIFLLAVIYKSYGQVGVTWTSQTSAADNNWFGVTYGNGLFVAVSGTSTGSGVMTSPDGITWTLRASPNGTWRSVTYGNGLFVAVSITGTGNRVMTSPDGITWTSQTSAADNAWVSVTYGNGLFVAVAVTGSGNRVMTSPDGITWTIRTSAWDTDWFSVTYGNGLFVAVGNTGGSAENRVMTSPDGISWTRRNAANQNNWSAVTYGNGLFVAVASGGAGVSPGRRVMTSSNGITWTDQYNIVDNSWNAVTYGDGLFVAVATSGTGDRVMTSPDGINWTVRASAADLTWNEVSYNDGLFVAVASSGTGNRVMTSGTLGVLPVQWGEFNAKRQGNSTLLTWSTLQEQNTADFEVQYSFNAQDWSSVGNIAAMGNSNRLRNYRFVHEGSFKPNRHHYYRIVQRDLDGKYSYSKVIKIEFPHGIPNLVLYPNPTSDVLHITLAERQELRLVNMQGVEVWKGVLSAGLHKIPVSNFAAGNYVLQSGKGTYKVMIH